MFFCLSFFLLAREVLPEIGHGIDAVSAGEGFLQTFYVVEIRADDFRALRGECFRFVLAGIACDRASGESAVRIVQNRPHQTTALRTSRSNYCNDFLICHVFLL